MIEAKDIGSIEMDNKSMKVVIYSHRGYPLRSYEYTDKAAMIDAFNRINTSWLRYLENQEDQTDEAWNKGMEVKR